MSLGDTRISKFRCSCKIKFYLLCVYVFIFASHSHDPQHPAKKPSACTFRLDPIYTNSVYAGVGLAGSDLRLSLAGAGTNHLCPRRGVAGQLRAESGPRRLGFGSRPAWGPFTQGRREGVTLPGCSWSWGRGAAPLAGFHPSPRRWTRLQNRGSLFPGPFPT